jgi:hypothetical protein
LVSPISRKLHAFGPTRSILAFRATRTHNVSKPSRRNWFRRSHLFHQKNHGRPPKPNVVPGTKPAGFPATSTKPGPPTPLFPAGALTVPGIQTQPPPATPKPAEGPGPFPPVVASMPLPLFLPPPFPPPLPPGTPPLHRPTVPSPPSMTAGASHTREEEPTDQEQRARDRTAPA